MCVGERESDRAVQCGGMSCRGGGGGACRVEHDDDDVGGHSGGRGVERTRARIAAAAAAIGVGIVVATLTLARARARAIRTPCVHSNVAREYLYNIIIIIIVYA